MLLSLFKGGICAGDTNVVLWELGHLRVFQNWKQPPNDPLSFCQFI